MKYYQLGKTDLKVSEIGYGCMSLSENHQENEKLIHQALEYGINYFDTADLYQKGFNEESLGKSLHEIRDQVVIATKVGNQWRADGSGWDWNPGKSYILEAIDGSLQRLKTDYIDLYQLHGGTMDDAIEETIDAFEILKQQGKIRHYGISSIRPNVIRQYLNKSHIESVMTQYSLLDRRPEEETLEMLHKNKISVVTRGTVAKGLLAGKSVRDYLGYTAEEVQKMANTVKELSKNYGSMTEVALKYVLQHPAVTSIVLGMSNSSQLKEAIKAVENEHDLSQEDRNKLKTALTPRFYEAHR